MTTPLTIVGGGIGGLSSAIALARKGKLVQVMERAGEFRAIGYGIQLGPNAFQAFQHLGIEQEVLGKCSLPHEGLLRDAHTAEVLLRVPMGSRMKECYGKPYAVIHRADLHQVLLDGCSRLGVGLTTNCELLNFSDDGGSVELETTRGRRVASALIAADGVASKVRSKLFNTLEPQKLGYAAFRAVHPMEKMPAKFGNNAVVLWCGAGYHMIHYPLRGGRLFNLVAVFDYWLDQARSSQTSLADRLIERFSSACEEVRELLGYVDLSQHWEIATIEPIGEWSKGRVALLGDAAHAMVQAMAQGACQAIEDSVVLAECLADAAGDETSHIEKSFRAYQGKRILRATRVQYMSRYMWELIHVRDAFSLLRRDLLAKFRESDVLEELSWLYGANGGKPRDIARLRYEPAL
jgi:2-polyprenyl-6-methoxyphenol hydroxylase-like FAD-dependent oxidoreductase